MGLKRYRHFIGIKEDNRCDEGVHKEDRLAKGHILVDEIEVELAEDRPEHEHLRLTAA